MTVVREAAQANPTGNLLDSVFLDRLQVSERLCSENPEETFVIQFQILGQREGCCHQLLKEFVLSLTA